LTATQRVLRLGGALIVLVGLGLGVAAGVEHVELRGRWSALAARVDTDDPDYDARESDRLYAALLERRLRAELGGWISFAGWVLLALSLGPREGRDEARDRRAHAAVLVDAAVIVAGVLVADQAEAWLGAPLAAWGALAAPAVLAMAAGYGWTAMANGRSLGAWITGTTVATRDARPPGLARGLGAFALLGFSVAWAPIALVVAPASRPPHLAWTGLRVVTFQGAKV